MTEYFRITGLNNILFDQGATGPYRLSGGSPPTGMSNPLTPQDVLGFVPRLPLGIRSHVLEHGLSIITCQINIQGATDALMEQYRHDLTETLEDAALYIETRGARGTRGVLRYKMDNVAVGNDSYKTIFYGTVNELAGRDVLGSKVKESLLQDMKLTLYCEPYWRPETTTNLVNAATVYNHDDADAGHNNYVDIAAASIKGDVPAPVRVRVRDSNMAGPKWFLIARRSAGTVTNFVHWLEAENATGKSGGGINHADTNRSGGLVVSDSSAGTSGLLYWTVAANLAHYKGRFAIYASCWADSILTTQFQSYITYGSLTSIHYLISKWKTLGYAERWQLVPLGELIIDDRHFATGGGLEETRIFLAYEKATGDTVEIDYIFLFPLDESAVRLDGHWLISFVIGADQIEVDDTRDFFYAAVEDSTGPDYWAALDVKGSPLTLQPNVINRLYFKLLNSPAGGDTFDEHKDYIDNDGIPAESYTIYVDYLPQFISPLE